MSNIKRNLAILAALYYFIKNIIFSQKEINGTF